MKDELLYHIACLFYAIAKADKTVSYEEYVRLSETLEQDWRHIGNFNSKVIKTHFNTLQKDNTSASKSFKAFTVFLHKHPNLFTTEIKTLILKTANKMAYAFAKINKSELGYMAKLSLELKRATS